MKSEWKPIRDLAAKHAASMGHKVGVFQRQIGRNPLKMAMCETCLGCCWIAVHPTKGFIMGGRLLKYKCGTNEAAGLLPQTDTEGPPQPAGGKGSEQSEAD